MTRTLRIGLILLMVSTVVTAAEPVEDSRTDDPIVGTEGDDTLVGTENDDEIFGAAGNDRIQGRAGDDVLIGGSGADILFGGAGSDQFIIDFVWGRPDEVIDFSPEEGDTLLLRFAYNPQDEFPRKRPTIKNIKIDYDGDVTMSLINEDQFDVVKLRRSDLTLKVDDLGEDIRLIFTKKIGN